MKFEIDVSGYDIFNDKKYVICIAGQNKESIKWFKFNKNLINNIISHWKNNEYRYGLSKKQKGLLKVRIYCTVIHYLFKSIKEKPEEIELTICRDFPGHKNNINENLRYLLEESLKIKIKTIEHKKLYNSSHAHNYASSVYKDEHGLFNVLDIDIILSDIEKYLKK